MQCEIKVLGVGSLWFGIYDVHLGGKQIPEGVTRLKSPTQGPRGVH